MAGPVAADAPLAAGAAYQVMHELITCVASPAETDGRMLVVVADVPPGGGPPPLHRHPPDELFHVIAGRATVFRGAGESERIDLAAGESTLVPGGVPHTFRNLSAELMRLLMVFTPGAMMAAFFAQAGRLVVAGQEPPAIDPEREIPRVLGIGASLGLETLDELPHP